MLPRASGPHIDEHVAALGDALDQLVNDEGRGLEELIGGVVAPTVVHGDAVSSQHRAVALLIENAFRRDDLLGADEIAAIFGGILRQQRTEAGAALASSRLSMMMPGWSLRIMRDEIGRAPLLPHHVGVGEDRTHMMSIFPESFSTRARGTWPCM